MEKQSRKGERKTFARSHHGCTNCRKSKVKCDQQKPTCTRCWQKDLQCSSAVQLKWESSYRERGVAFGRSGLWGKGPNNKPSPTNSPGSSASSSSETTWLATPTIQPWTFVNNDMLLMQRLCDEEQDNLRQRLLPPFDAKLAIGDQGPREPILSFSASSPLSSGSAGMDEASTLSLPLSPSLFPSLGELGNRVLFDYYINQICPRTAHSPLSQSPFSSVILPYCVSAPPTVLRAVQALAACHWSQYDPQYNSISLRLKSRVLTDFRKRINSDHKALAAEDPEILVIAMFLCLFDIVDDCDPHWIIHLQGAKDIIRLRRRQQLESSSAKNKATSQDDVSSFVELFFAFQDVMGRTACAKADLFGPSYWQEDDTTIDPWMGCSPALVSILFSVMDLSRSRRDMASDEDRSEFYARAATLNERLENLLQEPRTNENDPTIHRAAELKRLTCIVFLKCALYNGRPSDPEIKSYVRKIMDEILELLALESACHVIWPLFVAAVELDPLDFELCSNPDTGTVTDGRRLVLELLERMARSSVSSVSRTRMVIEQVWKARDLDLLKSSGAKRVSISDLNDWEQYVVPVSDALSLV